MASITNSLPKTITINPEIFEKFPGTKVGFLLAEINVHSPKSGAVYKALSQLKQDVVLKTLESGINEYNYRDLRVCQSWRNVFQTFDVEEDKVSTIETLLKRVSKEVEAVKAGKKANLGRISNIVDLYNCISIQTLTPMGALDFSKIKGNVQLRFGRSGETFTPLGKEKVTYPVTDKQVVYADDDSILTWLWNYRDAAHCCVPNESPAGERSYILLFADQAEQGNPETGKINNPGNVEDSIASLKELLPIIDGSCLESGFLDIKNPSVTLEKCHCGCHKVKDN